jgi:hypothetical protein
MLLLQCITPKTVHFPFVHHWTPSALVHAHNTGSEFVTKYSNTSAKPVISEHQKEVLT